MIVLEIIYVDYKQPNSELNIFMWLEEAGDP